MRTRKVHRGQINHIKQAWSGYIRSDFLLSDITLNLSAFYNNSVKNWCQNSNWNYFTGFITIKISLVPSFRAYFLS
jgi:hypothetical protein